MSSVGIENAGAINLAGKDFSFDPRTLALTTEAGSAQSGLCFDNWGRKFLCDFTRPLLSAMYDVRYFERNPYAPAPTSLIDVASPATIVFRPRTGQASNQVSTLQIPDVLRSEEASKATNLFAPAWLSAARGCAIYRGDVFSNEYFGNAFIADPADHLVHRAVLRQNGLGEVATRPSIERAAEFLTSSDESFHPVQVINGPEGALYVADCNEGDQGRIYRIVPINFREPKGVQFSKAGAYQLVASLASPNGWRRDTAARLLYQRRPPAALALLTNMLYRSVLPLARVQALHGLESMGTLDQSVIMRGLSDTNAQVRRHALLLSENFDRAGPVSATLWTQIRKLVADPSVVVRYQLAYSLGEFQNPGKSRVLAEVLARDLNNLWIRRAVLSSLSTGGADELAELASQPRFVLRQPGQDFLLELATMIGVSGGLDEVTKTIWFLSRAALQPLEKFALLGALGEGLRRTRSSLTLVDASKSLGPAYAEALSVAGNGSVIPAARVTAIQVLALSSYAYIEVRDLLLPLLNASELLPVQSAAIAAIARFNDPQAVADLLRQSPTLSPASRRQVATALLAHNDQVPTLLMAIESGKLLRADLAPAQIDLLRTYPDPGVASRAVRIFGPMQLRREDGTGRFTSAERLAGDPTIGRRIFLARCASCHLLGGEGRSVGPALDGVKVQGKRAILRAILEPSGELQPGYRTAFVQTEDGDNYVGIVAGEQSMTVLLRQEGGAEVVLPRGNIRLFVYQPWSLMPSDPRAGPVAQITRRPARLSNDYSEIAGVRITANNPGSSGSH